MKLGIALQIVAYLSEHDMASAPTLGDLGHAIGVPLGTALGERLREARTRYGFDIRCEVLDGRHRYWMPQRERQRARRYVASKIAQRKKAA